jgi:hypothetical protein
MMLAMRFLPHIHFFGPDPGHASNPEAAQPEPCVEETRVLKTLGWISAALGAVAIGLVVGREIRQRYKFNRRTPYDLYAHSGDELPDVECGVGI